MHNIIEIADCFIDLTKINYISNIKSRFNGKQDISYYNIRFNSYSVKVGIDEFKRERLIELWKQSFK